MKVYIMDFLVRTPGTKLGVDLSVSVSGSLRTDGQQH